MNSFLKGIITGAAGMLVLVVVVLVFRFFRNGTRKSMSIWRRRMNLKHYKRILAIVLLMSFWKIPVYGEPQTAQTRNSEESGTKRYSELEVDTPIEDLTGAAHEAIEQAAAEAARAAALASLEREAAAMREAQRLQGENSRLKQSRVKTAIITGVICFFRGHGGWLTNNRPPCRLLV
jgi:hypothetical protein